jgi:hypothetical protein
VLRAGVVLAVAGPVLAGCTRTPEAPPPPDPLAALAERARADAAAADSIATSVPALAGPAGEVAKARGEHAVVLQREVDRERPPASSTPPSTSSAPTPPAQPGAATKQLLDALKAAEQQAADLVASVPRYRAGMLGSVAASCASLREVFA